MSLDWAEDIETTQGKMDVASKILANIFGDHITVLERLNCSHDVASPANFQLGGQAKVSLMSPPEIRAYCQHSKKRIY